MELNGRADGLRKKKKTRLNRKESDILTRSIPSTKGETELIRSQIRKTGMLHMAGRKAPATAVCPELNKLKEKEEEEEEEDIELDKQFQEEEECNWLSSSSDCSSPSSFFQEYRFSSSLHLSVDDWLISWLSTLADSYLHLNEAETVTKTMKNGIEEEKGDFMDLSGSENSGDVSDLREPLVWPLGLKSEWSSPETWKCFSMSPRKGTTPSDQRRSSYDGSSESKLGVTKLNSCRRKLEFRSEAWRSGNSDSNSNMKEDEEMEQESIERVMGLGEFDGHEGVDAEFDSHVFSIDNDDIDL